MSCVGIDREAVVDEGHPELVPELQRAGGWVAADLVAGLHVDREADAGAVTATVKTAGVIAQAARVLPDERAVEVVQALLCLRSTG